MADEKPDALVKTRQSEALVAFTYETLANPAFIEPGSGLPWGVIIAAMAGGGLYPDSNTILRAIAKIRTGMDLGLKLTQSLQHIFVTESRDGKAKIGIESIVRASKIRESKVYDYEVIKNTDEVCEIEFTRLRDGQWRSLGTVTFTIQQARAAGLTDKYPWKAYPDVMLYNRCLAKGQRMHCPDVLGGAAAYDPDETEEIERADQPTIVESPRPAVNLALAPFFDRLGWRDAEVQMWLGRHRALTTDQMQALLGKELDKAKAAASPAPEPESVPPPTPDPEPPAAPQTGQVDLNF